MFPSILMLSEAATGQEAVPGFWDGIGAYFQSMFKKVGEIGLPMWIALIALAALAVLLLVLGSAKGKWNSTTIAYAALTIALSFLLSNIRLYRMPQGGSITAASMLPLMLFSYAFGLIPGLLTGLAYGVLQFLQTPSLLPISPFFAVSQVVLDYLLAFGCMGFVGLFGQKQANERINLPAGIALSAFLRFICSVASGALFFPEYAGDQNPILYSTIYNGSYMLPEMIICMVIGILVGPRLSREMRRSAGIK